MTDRQSLTFYEHCSPKHYFRSQGATFVGFRLYYETFKNFPKEKLLQLALDDFAKPKNWAKPDLQMCLEISLNS